MLKYNYKVFQLLLQQNAGDSPVVGGVLGRIAPCRFRHNSETTISSGGVVLFGSSTEFIQTPFVLQVR